MKKMKEIREKEREHIKGVKLQKTLEQYINFEQIGK